MSEQPTTRPPSGSREDYEEIARALRIGRLNINQGFNGSTKFVNWMLGLIMLLTAGGIVANVAVYGQVHELMADMRSAKENINYLMSRVR